MQLSFLYAATVFAAAWASHVPDSANQAVATQSISERAITYYEDDLVGSTSDGDSFTDMGTLSGFEVIPTIKQVVILTGERINHVKLSGFFGDASVTYNAPHGHDAESTTTPQNFMDVHLDLADGEWLKLVRVQSVPFGPGATEGDLGYMRFETNLGNSVEAGVLRANYGVKDFSPPAGYTRVVGFHGTDGDWVDSIGPIWAY